MKIARYRDRVRDLGSRCPRRDSLGAGDRGRLAVRVMRSPIEDRLRVEEAWGRAEVVIEFVHRVPDLPRPSPVLEAGGQLVSTSAEAFPPAVLPAFAGKIRYDGSRWKRAEMDLRVGPDRVEDQRGDARGQIDLPPATRSKFFI